MESLFNWCNTDGAAFVFDGLDDRVLAPPPDYADGNSVSFSFWFLSPTNCSTDLTDTERWILNVGKEFGARRNRKSCELLDVFFGKSGSGIGLHALQIPFTPGVWNHFTGTFDGNGPGTLTGYLNGRFIAQTTEVPPSSNVAACVQAGTREVTIGSNNTACKDLTIDSGFYLGRIDELMLFNRALEATEVEALARYPVCKDF